MKRVVLEMAGVSIWISGLPGTTPEGWEGHFVGSILDPPHVSSYDLQVEEGTAFGKWYSRDDQMEDRRSSRQKRPRTRIERRRAFWRSHGYLHYECRPTRAHCR